MNKKLLKSEADWLKIVKKHTKQPNIRDHHQDILPPEQKAPKVYPCMAISHTEISLTYFNYTSYYFVYQKDFEK